MKKIIVLKNIFIVLIMFSSILFYNCTSDQNVTGFNESENPTISKIITNDIAYEDINLDTEEIEVQVAPNVLNIQNNGVVVTIHTDIPYSQVIALSVSLNGIEIQSWKADSQGFFVAKFNIEEVKALVDPEIEGYNTLTLIGESTTGDFSGSEDILVISKTGR